MQDDFLDAPDLDLFGHLLAVTNRHLAARPFLEQLRRVARLGPRAVILREKDLPEPSYKELAKQAMALCAAEGVRCILHTFVGTAKELDSKAVHLPLALLEKSASELRAFEVIGASVHSKEEALRAEQLGATYLSAGHVFATECKPGLAPRGLEFLREVAGAVKIPVYGIGGVKLDKGQLEELLKAGAAGGCVMSSFMRV